MIDIQTCNNNIIFAMDNRQEIIALKKGIGFNIHPGDDMDHLNCVITRLKEALQISQRPLPKGRGFISPRYDSNVS